MSVNSVLERITRRLSLMTEFVSVSILHDIIVNTEYRIA